MERQYCGTQSVLVYQRRFGQQDIQAQIYDQARDAALWAELIDSRNGETLGLYHGVNAVFLRKARERIVPQDTKKTRQELSMLVQARSA